MKECIYKSLLILLGVYLFISIGCSKDFEGHNGNGPDPVPSNNTHLTTSKIIVTFSAIPENFNITIPPLKYNKDFCLGLHLDDGAEDIYSHAYKLLNGGKIGEITYQGLKYTDGCGNDIKFKMSSAIYSMDNTQTIDLHDPDIYNGYVKWPQINEMYKSGWGVYNHGLTAIAALDPVYSIVSNFNYVKSKTADAVEGGIDMKIFVNPDGDTTYTEYAFQQNYRIAYVEFYPFGKPYFNVTEIWSKSNIRMGRTLLVPQVNLTQLVDEMDALSINGAHYWGSAFSHSVTNENYGYSFEMFRDYMIYIANKYGKNGFDNIWMATEEETLDYSILKDLIIVNETHNGNSLEITFSGNIPDNLRFYNISLILTTNINITSIDIEGASQSSSYNGINTNTSLINIDCDKL